MMAEAVADCMLYPPVRASTWDFQQKPASMKQCKEHFENETKFRSRLWCSFLK